MKHYHALKGGNLFLRLIQTRFNVKTGEINAITKIKPQNSIGYR